MFSLGVAELYRSADTAVMRLIANIGLPMILVQWPLMLGALVPVIVVEALLIRRRLDMSYRQAFIGAGIANVVSTLAGVPVAWVGTFLLNLVVMVPLGLAAQRWSWQLDGPIFQVVAFVFSASWLGPAEGHLHWMVPTAVGLLLLPCCIVSVLIERSLCKRIWPTVDRMLVDRAVFRVNLASYTVLFLLAGAWATYAVAVQGSFVKH
jgi:hypothetical protein